MFRPVLTEIALFLAPFLVYAVFVWATRGKVFVSAHWPVRHVIALTVVAVVLTVGTFAVLTHFSGAPPGSSYEPAHIENGKLVPGRVK